MSATVRAVAVVTAAWIDVYTRFILGWFWQVTTRGRRGLQAAEVRSAYRRLALVYHPDKARTGCVYACSLSGPLMTVRDVGLHDRVVAAADDLFKIVNEAFTTLSDDAKRSKCARQLGHARNAAGFGMRLRSVPCTGAGERCQLCAVTGWSIPCCS